VGFCWRDTILAPAEQIRLPANPSENETFELGSPNSCFLHPLGEYQTLPPQAEESNYGSIRNSLILLTVCAQSVFIGAGIYGKCGFYGQCGIQPKYLAHSEQLAE
jgi:hypothetical protein